MTIGELIATARKKRGYSQLQLAEICGIHHASIAKIEVGTYNPSIRIVNQILDALGYELALKRKV